jgi:hypothetical protein
VRQRAQLPECQRPRLDGQLLVRRRGVLVTQDAGLVLDDPYVDRMQSALGQGGEGTGQPLGDRGRVVDLPGGGLPGQVQPAGQLVGGELGPVALLTAAAGGELPDRGQLGPGDPGLHPARGGDDADQLVIGQRGQPVSVVAGESVHHGSQQRARRHRVGFAVLGEPGHVQVLGGQAYEQALLQAVGRLVIFRPRSLRRGRHGATGLLVVTPRAGKRVLAHAPPSVRKKS